jgi:RsiW-degrading membrane proteinase PrsW (M82 family)
MTPRDIPGWSPPATMTCERCGRAGPLGPFCTWCGEPQTRQPTRMAGRRSDRYAAHPNEDVLHPGVLTTLFPHLAPGGINTFRWALLIGLVGVAVLSLAGLTLAAILGAAVLVPVLYVLYLYEARVYRDDPVSVVGLTMGGGAIVGVSVSIVLRVLSSHTPVVTPSPFGGVIDLGAVAFAAVLVPVVQEALKPLPALLLRRRAEFRESIDGLTFGIAAGLGFAVAETLVQFADVLGTLPLQTEPGAWLFPLVSIAVMKPLLHGSTTGLITLALWRAASGGGPRVVAVIVGAVLGHALFVLGGIVVAAAELTPLYALAWQALVVGGLLTVIRVQLHRALLEEATDLGLAETTCPNCDREVTAAAFCPECGMAQAAVPRHVRLARRDVAAGQSEGVA